jgi:hypothetical protein
MGFQVTLLLHLLLEMRIQLLAFQGLFLNILGLVWNGGKTYGDTGI